MTDTQRPRTTLRSIWAVFAGLLACFALSLGTDMIFHALGIYPPWGRTMSGGLFLLATAYRIPYGIVSGFVAARLAPANPMRHAMILGAIGLLFSIAGVVGTWNKGPEFGPRWYPLAVAAMALPCAFVGGRLAMRAYEARMEPANA